MLTIAKTVRTALAATVCLSAAALFPVLTPTEAVAQAAGEREIRFSHHFPENPADWRYSYPQAFADALNKAGVGLKVTIFPDQRLMRAKEQWGALAKGAIDLSMFSLAELAEGAPEVQALGLPAVIRDVDHAIRLGASPFMSRLRDIVEEQGVTILSGGVWLVGGVGSAKDCVQAPAHLLGMAMRTSSKTLDQLFEGAGALTVSLPSSELQKGLTTGAIDGMTFPVASFVSSSIRSEIKCLTVPGPGGTLFFTYAPIVASKTGLASLTDAQRAAVQAAALSAAAATQERINKMSNDAESIFTAAGVKVERLDAASFAAWRAEAEKTSYVHFVKSSPRAAEVLDLMKAVP